LKEEIILHRFTVRFLFEEVLIKLGPILFEVLFWPKSFFEKNRDVWGKSKKNEKNKTSAIKNNDPGNPKNIKVFNNIAKNSLGHKKLIPLTSVINLVLNLLAIASTSKKEFVEIKA
jgi:hypothetical protein